MRRTLRKLRIEDLERRALLKAPAEAPPLGAPPAPGPDTVWVDTEQELQNAVVNLQSGQTIVIQKGTYNLTKTLYIGAYGRQVTGATIRGETENFDDVILRGRGMENPNYAGVPHGISVYNAQDLTIANLSVGEVYFHPIDLQGIQGADRVHIYHVRAFDGGEQLIKSNAGGGGADFCTIEYSLIEYTAGPPVTDHGGGVGYTGGLHAHEVDGWALRHNVWRNFHTNDSSSFPYNPVVLMWNASRDTLVEGNTFIDCDRAVAFGLVDKAGFDHQGGVIRNNFVYQRPGLFSAARRLGSDAQILVYDSPDTKVYHNTVLTNGNSRLSIEVRWAISGVEFKNNLADAPLSARNGGIYTASGNYLGATPTMFVDPAAGDLHLLDNAATRMHIIDRVLADAATDWDADVRPSGSAADVGADELRIVQSSPLILDNGDNGFNTTGGWLPYPNQGYQADVHYTASGSGAEAATWGFSGLTPGRYRVSATWSEHPNRATNAPFTVFDGSSAFATLLVNQELTPNDLSESGAAWEDLGIFNITSNSLLVRLTNNANDYVIADAIRIQRMGDLPSAPEIQVLDGSTDIFDNSGNVVFGTTPPGTPVIKTFTVRNTGTSDLTLTGPISVPAGFTLVSSFGSISLPPSASTTFSVRLDAAADGSYSGQISFASNDTDENPFNFAVSGAVGRAPLVIDNGDAGFSTAGQWTPYSGQGLLGDVHYSAAGNGTDVATWSFTGLAPGQYRVSATWSEHANRATNAPFTMLDETATLGTVLVNQELPPNDFSEGGTGWKDLGVFNVTASTLVVHLRDNANEYVIADAIRIERLAPLPSVQVIYVSTTAEFRSAVASATPGTQILLRSGVYAGDNFFTNVQGTADRPILIAAADPLQMPIFRGGGEGLHFSDSAYLELRNLIVEAATSNGINIDDAGTYDTPAHHVTLAGLIVRNIGPSGNRDGIKLSGVQQFVVKDSTILSWGDGGSGIDMVGCHDGVIQVNTFRHGDFTGANGVQAKGGSSNIRILDNRFEHAGLRAIQIGGSTGLQFFRPQPPQGYEAKDVTVEGNVIIGSEAAIAFVNVDGALVRYNSIYRPRKWVIRILQETTAPGFVPCRNGVFTDNIIAFRSDEVQTAVNVGINTAPETFQFARNWWYCLNDPARSRLSLPTAETNGVYGVDPQFVDGEGGDLHLRTGSPAINVGAYAPRNR